MSFLDKMRSSRPDRDPVLDPVCGMRIDPSDAAGSSVFEGKPVHFCAARCKARFDADPLAFRSRLG